MNWIQELFASLGNIFLRYWSQILIGLILLICALLIIRLLRAITSRWIFILKLKRTAKKHGMDIEVCRSPFATLFGRTVRPDLKLKAPDATLRIFFCPGLIRRKKLYVFDDTKLYTSKINAHSFWLNRHHGFSPSLVSVEEADKKEITLSISHADQEQSVLLIEPSPIGLFVNRGNGYAPSGSGERVGKLLIYEGQDFIHYINRHMEGTKK